MAITSTGIGSNLDVAGIVSQLMAIEKQPVTALNTKEASFQSKLTAYGTLKSAISSFQSSLTNIKNASSFLTFKASVSDSTIASASTSSVAKAGSYSLDIAKVAQSQKLIATGQASTSSTIGTGTSTTLTFDFGSITGGTLTSYVPSTGVGGTYSGASFASSGSGTKSITIDSSNNTLSGIRDAINGAALGVTATILNDGSSNPYRLVLTTSTGQSSSLKITSSGGDATVSNLLTYNPEGTQNLQQTQLAQNTELTLDGVFVSRNSNFLSDAIPGVTLNAIKAGTSTLTVSQDSSTVVTSVTAFVKAYNDLNTSLRSLSAYNATTNTAAILQGDDTVRNIQSQLRRLLGAGITGAGSYSSLSDIGISFQKDGSLALNSTKFQSALTSSPTDVSKVFASNATTSDGLVSYLGASSTSKPGTYNVSVSQLATQGSLAGAQAANLTIVAGVNDALTVNLDGSSSSVNLTAGVYTASTLALEVQSKINGSSAFSSSGLSVKVSQTGGILTIGSNSYGASSAVTVTGIGADDLLGSARVATNGLNVAGSINGAVASGSGQILTGAAGDNSAGIRLLVSGGVTGTRGTVAYSQGYAYQLDSLLTNILSSSGSITSRTDGINKTIKDISSQRDKLNTRLVGIQKRYLAQFTALDTAISNFTKTSNFLTQQLAVNNKSSG